MGGDWFEACGETRARDAAREVGVELADGVFRVLWERDDEDAWGWRFGGGREGCGVEEVGCDDLEG